MLSIIIGGSCLKYIFVAIKQVFCRDIFLYFFFAATKLCSSRLIFAATNIIIIGGSCWGGGGGGGGGRKEINYSLHKERIGYMYINSTPHPTPSPTQPQPNKSFAPPTLNKEQKSYETKSRGVMKQRAEEL